MIKYLSPTVLAAVLRVSSTPVFSIQLALTSLLALREVPAATGNTANTANTSGTANGNAVLRATLQEGANHV
jgi:hypothetical protein